MKTLRILVLLLPILHVSAIGQPTDAREKWQRARNLVTQGRPAEAVPIFEELLAASPGNPTLTMNLVVAHFQAGQYEEVIGLCKPLVETRNDWAPPWLFLGASHFQLGRPKEAIEPLQTVLRLQPDERNARLMLAEALLQVGQPAEAAKHFESLRESLPTEARVWYGLDRSYDALETGVLEEIEGMARGSAEWHALAGWQETEAKRYGRAIRHYRDALALKPDFPGLHSAVAAVYRAAGKDDWAGIEEGRTQPVDCDRRPLACKFQAGLFREIVAAPAEGDIHAAYWHARAFQKLRQGAFDRLQSLPESPQVHELKARAFDDQLRHREAAEEWREALALSPDNRVLQHGLAFALFQGRELEEAAKVLANLVEQEPDSAEVHLLYGRVLLDQQKPEEALPHLEKALDLDPDDATANGALGEACVKTGQGKRAIPHLRAALGADEDGSWYFQLAQAYRAAGDREAVREAIQGFQKLRQAAEDRQLERQREYPIPAPE